MRRVFNLDEAFSVGWSGGVANWLNYLVAAVVGFAGYIPVMLRARSIDDPETLAADLYTIVKVGLASGDWAHSGLQVLALVVATYSAIVMLRLDIEIASNDGRACYCDWLPGEEFLSFLGLQVVLGAAYSAVIDMVGPMAFTTPIGWGVTALVWLISLRIGFAGYFIASGQLSPAVAVEQSWGLTEGHVTHLLLFYVLAALTMVAGFIALVVGVLIAGPVVSVARGSIFHQLTRIDR